MFKDLKTLYSNLLPYRDMINNLSLTEVGNGLLLRIDDVYISDTPKTVTVNSLRVIWTAFEINVSQDDRGEVEYSGLSIYANNKFIAEILL